MRRAKPDKREILPDMRYNSVHIQTMVQHVLKRGKKSVAVGLIYKAMDLIKERTEKNPLDVFDGALKNVSPVMEVRPRRVGGRTVLRDESCIGDTRTWRCQRHSCRAGPAAGTFS